MPIERRTMAPTPSDCSRARRVVRIRRGIKPVDMVDVLAAAVVVWESGKRARPEKVNGVAALISARWFEVPEVVKLACGEMS